VRDVDTAIPRSFCGSCHSVIAYGGISTAEHVVRHEKLMKGVPLARAPAAARSTPERISGSVISIGSMNDIANVEPGASVATWRNVAMIASFVRYLLTPVDATTAGLRGSKPDAASLFHQHRPLRNQPAPVAGRMGDAMGSDPNGTYLS
jgi:hypothetical protein